MDQSQNSQNGSALPRVSNDPNQQLAPEVEPASKPVVPSSFDEGGTQSPQVIVIKKRRRRLWVIMTILFMVLVSGSAAAYQFWYQNPEKVVSDGVIHFLQAKNTSYTGSAEYGTGIGKVSLRVNGIYDTGAQNLNADVTISMGAINLNTKGSVLIDRNSDVYVKIKDIDRLLLIGSTQYPEEIRAQVEKITAKINDTWVKVDATAVSDFDVKTARAQTCWSNAVQQTENHASFLKEISDSYKKNRFITVSRHLGEKEGSLGYMLRADQEILTSFINDIKETQAYKTLHGCDATFTLDAAKITQFLSATNYETEVWVSTFGHDITKVTNKTSQNGVSTTFELAPVFNQAVSVEAPKNATSLKDLQQDYEVLLQQLTAYYQARQ